MIEINNVHKSFVRNEVLKGVTFRVAEGSLAGLIGPSGGGKSVLMKIIGGVLESDGGEISFSKDGASGLSPLGLMFQEGALFDSLTVFDNVAFPLVRGRVPVSRLRREIREDVSDRVFEILGRVGLASAALKMPGQISGGMRRRVSLARALVSRPRTVLLDDPTAGLDPVASSVIMDLILELQEEYRPTMLIISHDLRRLLPIVGRIFALFDGRITFAGTLKELIHSDDSMLRTFVACRFDFKSAMNEASGPVQSYE